MPARTNDSDVLLWRIRTLLRLAPSGAQEATVAHRPGTAQGLAAAQAAEALGYASRSAIAMGDLGHRCTTLSSE